MDMLTWVQILEEAICFSDNATTLMKCMNPTILPQATGK